MNDITVNDFMKIREVNVMRIKEGKENDLKVVGIYCTYCPQELVLAAGAAPVSLCGTKEEPIAAAEEILPRNLCPLIKSSFGFAVSDTCPFFHFSDLVIGETTCDGKKKMFELMGEIKPVHVMQLPHTKNTEAAFDLWVDEIRSLRKKLEEQLGVTISDEAIWNAIDLVNRETQAAKSLCDLNQMDPPALNGLDLLTVTWSRSFGIDKAEIAGMMEDLTQKLQSQDSELTAGKPRILLTGCPVGLGTEKVIRLVDELGGNVVCMENCTGYKTLSLQSSREYDDPIVALAHKYIQIPCSCMSPNTYRMELLTQMIDEFKIDAVIDLTWQACHTYNIESYEVARTVRQKDIPFLHLESDYSTSDLEALKVRIEALLEMI